MREGLKYALHTTRMFTCVSALPKKTEENIVKLNVYIIQMMYSSKSHLTK